jgi:hypothetical protein
LQNVQTHQVERQRAILFDCLIGLRKCSKLWGTGFNHRALYAIAKGIGQGSVLIPSTIQIQLRNLEHQYAQGDSFSGNTGQHLTTSATSYKSSSMAGTKFQHTDDQTRSIKQAALAHIRCFIVRNKSSVLGSDGFYRSQRYLR